MPLLLARDDLDKALPLRIDADGNLVIAGNTSGGVGVPIQVDANGKLFVAELPSVVVSTLPSLPAGANEIGSVGNRGWYANDYYKDPLRFGYSGVYREEKRNQALAAGTNILTFTTVPAGYIYVVNFVSILYVGTSPAYVEMRIRDSGGIYRLLRELTPTSGRLYSLATQIVMITGDYIEGVVSGATANDDLYAYAYGYKIQLVT